MWGEGISITFTFQVSLTHEEWALPHRFWSDLKLKKTVTHTVLKIGKHSESCSYKGHRPTNKQQKPEQNPRIQSGGMFEGNAKSLTYHTFLTGQLTSDSDQRSPTRGPQTWWSLRSKGWRLLM